VNELKEERSAKIVAVETRKGPKGLPQIKYMLVAGNDRQIIYKQSGLFSSVAMSLVLGDLETLSLTKPKNLFNMNEWHEALRSCVGKWVRIRIHYKDGFRIIHFLEELKNKEN